MIIQRDAWFTLMHCVVSVTTSSFAQGCSVIERVSSTIYNGQHGSIEDEAKGLRRALVNQINGFRIDRDDSLVNLPLGNETWSALQRTHVNHSDGRR